MTINELLSECFNIQLAKGWPERSVGEDVALIHSEVSEMLEEYRNHHEPTEIYYHNDVDQNGTVVSKPEGIPIEAADILIRVFCFCAQHGINLEAAVREKIEFNRARPPRHGGKKI